MSGYNLFIYLCISNIFMYVNQLSGYYSTYKLCLVWDQMAMCKLSQDIILFRYYISCSALNTPRVYFLRTCTRNHSCIVVALTNILNYRHKQPDPEQLSVCHKHICSVRRLNPRHAALQSVAPPLRRPCRQVMMKWTCL